MNSGWLKCGLVATRWSGVLPWASPLLLSAPAARSASTLRESPNWAAWWRAVRPAKVGRGSLASVGSPRASRARNSWLSAQAAARATWPRRFSGSAGQETAGRALAILWPATELAGPSSPRACAGAGGGRLERCSRIIHVMAAPRRVTRASPMRIARFSSRHRTWLRRRRRRPLPPDPDDELLRRRRSVGGVEGEGSVVTAWGLTAPGIF